MPSIKSNNFLLYPCADFKGIVWTLLLTFSSTVSFSQFNYGIRGGVQFATVNIEKNNPDWKISYHGGVFVSYAFDRKFSVVGDLLYSDKGFQYSVPGTNDIEVNTFHLTYINLPLIAQYNLGKRFFVLGGVEAGKLLSSYEIDSQGNKTDLKGYSNKFDLGLTAGLAYQISPRLNLMLRYTEGLTNTLDGSKSYHSSPVNNNRVVQLSIGYAFRKNAIDSSFHISDHERRAIISFGVRQGISYNTLIGTGVDSRIQQGATLTNRIGYEAGIELRFDIYKYAFASIGLGYVQKGGQLDGGTAAQYYGPVKVDYLSVPILTGFSPIKKKVITASIEGGIGINYLISSQNPYAKDSAPSDQISKHTNIISFIYGFELSTDALNNVNLFVNYRKVIDDAPFHTVMTTTINNNSYTYHDYELKNRGDVFCVGVRYKLTRSSRHEAREIDLQEKKPKGSYVMPFAFGIKAGINLNSTAYKDMPPSHTDNGHVQVGEHVGLFFQIKLFRNFAFIPEVQFISKGYRYKNKDLSTSGLSLYYLEQPFMLSYSPIKSLSVEAGPVVGVYLTSATKGEQDAEKSSDYNIVEFGANGGLRYKLSKNVSIACRYYQSIKNMGDVYFTSDNGLPSNTREYNVNVQLSTYFIL